MTKFPNILREIVPCKFKNILQNALENSIRTSFVGNYGP